MPPRKEKISDEELRQLTHEKHIQLKGPVPPKEWPNRYKHIFKVIRKIDTIRYDDYKADQRIPEERRRDFMERISYLRQEVYKYLDDLKVNEDTWRELERSILRRFDDRVICERCNNELWKLDFEANPFHAENQAELKKKRLRRKMCCCQNERAISRTENNDDENRALFDFERGEAIAHALDDNLQNISIPMRPDRVIGLRAPSRTLHNPSHFPISGKRILLPFLVVEAKREKDAPGFRAIQYQTAFPIRRLLRAQKDLHSPKLSSEPCLVWFFAYQGEQWRLHAGVHEDKTVNVYDLWQGTIQSQDGALQLLLIVDYIWSWARDVYRPSVMKLLHDSTPGIRDFSAASTIRFRHSVSLSSVASPTTITHDVDMMQVDEVVDDIERPTGTYHRVDQRPRQIEEQATKVLEDASSHSSLRWVAGHQLAPSWTKFGSMRLSNIVHFEFRYFNFRKSQLGPDDRLVFDTLHSSAFVILPNELDELATLWTTNHAPISRFHPEKALLITIFFQTYFDPLTWQIKRVLNCVLWSFFTPLIPFTPIITRGPMDNLKRAVVDTQRICGRDSVWYALQNLSLVFLPFSESRGPNWVTFDEVEMPDRAFELFMGLARSTTPINFIHICSSMLHIVPVTETQLRSTIPDLERDTRTGDSMLVVRSPYWPAACPRFCLFVLQGVNRDENEVLHQLLKEARELRNFYVENEDDLTSSDRRTLRHWRKALEEED